jgi:hypothetical protein
MRVVELKPDYVLGNSCSLINNFIILNSCKSDAESTYLPISFSKLLFDLTLNPSPEERDLKGPTPATGRGVSLRPRSLTSP